MELLTTIVGILGVVGGVITIISFFVRRDNATKDAERRITEIEVKQELYKEELDLLRSSVGSIETKLMDKLDSLASKFDSLYEKFIDLKKD